MSWIIAIVVVFVLWQRVSDTKNSINHLGKNFDSFSDKTNDIIEQLQKEIQELRAGKSSGLKKEIPSPQKEIEIKVETRPQTETEVDSTKRVIEKFNFTDDSEYDEEHEEDYEEETDDDELEPGTQAINEKKKGFFSFLAKIEPFDMLFEDESDKMQSLKQTTQDLNEYSDAGTTSENENSKKSEFWKNIEEQFIQNWTGILGSISLVAGTGFLCIYAAIQVSPFFRFLMICALCALLIGISIYLKTKEYWINVALWVRSSSAAIFLFGCLGAGGIPGLKWLNSPVPALGLLMLGIGINLIIGYLGKSQIFAATHVLLSLIALSIAVPSAIAGATSSVIVLIVASIVTLLGTAINFKEKWQYHLLITLSSFYIFHLYWCLLIGVHQLSTLQNISGITTVLAVGVLGLLVHYTDLYKTGKMESLALAIHLLNWGLLGTGLLLHYSNSPLSTIALAGAAIIAYMHSRRAKHNDIHWLYITDTLIAELIALIAICSLYKSHIGVESILVIGLIEIIIFTLTSLIEKEKILIKVGFYLIYGSSLINILYLMRNFGSAVNTFSTGNAIHLFVGLSAMTVFHMIFRKFFGDNDTDIMSCNVNETETIIISITSIITALFPLFILANLYQNQFSGYVFALIMAFLFLIERKIVSPGLTIGLLFTSILGNILICHHVMSNDLSVMNLFNYGLPLVMLTSLAIDYSRSNIIPKLLQLVYAYSQGISILIFSYLISKAYSPLLAGIVWLIFSLIYLSISQYLSRKNQDGLEHISKYLLHCGYLFVAGFVIRHITVDIQSNATIMIFRIRTLIEVFGIGVLAYWASEKKPTSIGTDFTWKYLHPLFIDLIILGSTLLLYLSIDKPLLSIIWMIFSYIVLFARDKEIELSRLKLYSLIYFWISVIFTLFQLTSLISPTLSWYMQPWLLGSCAVLLQLTYLHINYRQHILEEIKYPPALIFLKDLSDKIVYEKRTGIYLYAISLIFISYKLFGQISPLLPGIIWLVLSIIYLEYSNYLTNTYNEILEDKGKTNDYILHCGYLFILAFIIRHFTVDIQASSFLGFISIKLAIELFALAVFVYWAFAEVPAVKRHEYSWKTLHPLLVELIFLTAISIVSINVHKEWHAPLWMVFSFGCLYIGEKYKALSRLKFYSYLLYILSTIQVAIITSTVVTPSLRVLDQTWTIGLFAIALQITYLIYSYRKNLLADNEFPDALSSLGNLSNQLHIYQKYNIFYPLFICIALFLAWSFDKSILSLLWVIEAFVIFIISVLLSNNHFRYVSMIVIGLCLIRLIMFDLVNSGTLARALVFIGVGIIMIFMNTVYNRYKGRFDYDKG